MTTVQYLTGLWIQSNKHLRRQVGVSSSGACILHAVSCNIISLIVGWHMNTLVHINPTHYIPVVHAGLIVTQLGFTLLSSRQMAIFKVVLHPDKLCIHRPRHTFWGTFLTTPSSVRLHHSVCWRATVHMKHDLTCCYTVTMVHWADEPGLMHRFSTRKPVQLISVIPKNIHTNYLCRLSPCNAGTGSTWELQVEWPEVKLKTFLLWGLGSLFLP